MSRMDLSERGGSRLSLQEEIRQSDRRVDAMVREAMETAGTHLARSRAMLAKMETAREEARVARQQLREKIERLPPPAEAA